MFVHTCMYIFFFASQRFVESSHYLLCTISDYLHSVIRIAFHSLPYEIISSKHTIVVPYSKH